MSRKAIRWLYGELPGLVDRGVLSPESAEALRRHYGPVPESNTSRIFISICAAFGSILILLGIILIFAHNWDELGRPVRALLSVLPLAITGGLGGWITARNLRSTAWHEGLGAAHFLAIGAALALIGQTYHLDGTFHNLCGGWLLLAAPLLYFYRSVSVPWLFLILSYNWLWTSPYVWDRNPRLAVETGLQILALLAVVPCYLRARRPQPFGISATLLAWALGIATVLSALTLATRSGINPLPFLSLCALFLYLIDKAFFHPSPSFAQRPFYFFGGLALFILVFPPTFDELWNDREWRWDWALENGAFQIRLALSGGLLAGCLWLLRLLWKTGRPFNVCLPILPLILALGLYGRSDGLELTGLVLANLYAFAFGAWHVKRGIDQARIGILNIGLATLAIQIFLRFIDTEASFLARGIAFLLLGASFFAVNIWFMRRRKAVAP